MEKIGSEFIDDFEKREKTMFKLTYRELLLFFSFLSLMILIAVTTWYEYPDIIYKTYFILVSVPGIFFGLEAEKKLQIKDRLYFFFLEKKRVYQTELENIKKGDK